jgi:two-component system response regulator NreC
MDAQRDRQVIRALIVDDYAVLRRRVRDLLTSEPDIEVVCEAADGMEALRQARQLKPDLILMDIRMSGINGLDATLTLRSEMPEIRVIVVTMYDMQEYREAAAACGASGYVVKRRLAETLLPTIRGLF